MLISVNSAPSMFFIDSPSDTLMRDEHFLPSLPAHQPADQKTSISLCFYGSGRCFSVQLSWQLYTGNVCVEFLIPPHSAVICRLCFVHMAVAVEPVQCFASIPGDCPEQRVLTTDYRPFLDRVHFSNKLPLITQAAVNKLSSLDAFWVVTLCVCVGFLNHF